MYGFILKFYKPCCEMHEWEINDCEMNDPPKKK